MRQKGEKISNLKNINKKKKEKRRRINFKLISNINSNLKTKPPNQTNDKIQKPNFKAQIHV